MISLHDHFVREFAVYADAKKLWLRTAYPQAQGPYVAEAVFEGVECYVMVGDALGTIIFDVEEVDALSLYDDFAETLRDNYRQGGAHAHWVRARDEAQRFCQQNELKGPVGRALSGSLGLHSLWPSTRRSGGSRRW
jgi:hypothetical protein